MPPARHDDLALEALLPAELRGQILVRESARADRTLGDDPASVAMRDLLARNGRAPSDLVIATAYSTDPTFGMYVAAFRATGIDPTALRNLLVEISAAQGPVEQAEKEVGGKPVLHVTDTPSGLSTYLYTTADTMFLVETLDPVLAAELLASLP